MGGKKSSPAPAPAPQPVTAVPIVSSPSQYLGRKEFGQEKDLSDIETSSDLYIKKKRQGKRSLRSSSISPEGGATVPTSGGSGLSVPY